MALETQAQDNRKTALCVSLEILQSVISDNQESVHECLNIKSLVDEMEFIKQVIPLLTNTEFGILRLLISQPWKIFSRNDLKDTLNSPHVDDRTIDNHMGRIRGKMSSLKPGLEKKIDSVYAWWYSFQLWEFSLDLFKEKIEINNWVYFIPQIHMLVYDSENDRGEDSRITLTITESRVLQILINKPWKIFSRNDLKDTLKSPHVDDRTIDNHIKKIRGKMSSLKPGLEKKIDPVYSLWYSFQLWEFSLDLFKEKIEINNWVYFIPQIYALVSRLEGEWNQDYKKVILTKTEFKMFQVLINEPWKTFSRDYFLDILWDFWDINDRGIDAFIKKIRKKMNSLIPSLGDKIVTNYWSWYYFQLWEHSLDLSEKKIEIDDWIYFVPEIQSIVSELESEWKKMIDLTAEEFIIFQALVKSTWVIFERDRLLNIIWNEWYQNDRKIDSHIKRLRKKLDTIKPWLKIRLKTEHWQGYKWQ